jgi:hypothetical protein
MLNIAAKIINIPTSRLEQAKSIYKMQIRKDDNQENLKQHLHFLDQIIANSPALVISKLF